MCDIMHSASFIKVKDKHIINIYNNIYNKTYYNNIIHSVFYV